MECRKGCGACCIALSISSSIPGMEQGKPAGMRCLHLSDDNLCLVFGMDNRPLVCKSLTPSIEMCGNDFEHAMLYLTDLERKTAPDESKI